MMMKRKTNFEEMHLLKIVYNLLCSLTFLHEANIMHRDIKSSNILINGVCQIKICDFGLSRTIPKNSMGTRGFNSISIREEYFAKKKNELDLLSKHDEHNYISDILVLSKHQRT